MSDLFVGQIFIVRRKCLWLLVLGGGHYAQGVVSRLLC